MHIYNIKNVDLKLNIGLNVVYPLCEVYSFFVLFNPTFQPHLINARVLMDKIVLRMVCELTWMPHMKINSTTKLLLQTHHFNHEYVIFILFDKVVPLSTQKI